MRRLGKSKTGFTLVEMVLVVAIIVILAGVLAMSISTFINRAKNASSNVNTGVTDLSVGLSASEADLAAKRF